MKIGFRRRSRSKLIWAFVFLAVIFLFLGGQRQHKKKKGVIISFNATRFARTAGILTKCGLVPYLSEPVDYRSEVVQWGGAFSKYPKLQDFDKTLSNKLSHRKAVLSIAHDSSLSDNDWSLVFEDDVDVVSGISPRQFNELLDFSLGLDAPLGFAYLGLCSPNCSEQKYTHLGVEIQRCIGNCVHAYAVRKKNALWIFDEMFGLHPLSDQSDSSYHYFDLQMMYGFQKLPANYWPVLVGSNLHQPGIDNTHKGIFFQDRNTFPSELGEPVLR